MSDASMMLCLPLLSLALKFKTLRQSRALPLTIPSPIRGVSDQRILSFGCMHNLCSRIYLRCDNDNLMSLIKLLCQPPVASLCTLTVATEPAQLSQGSSEPAEDLILLWGSPAIQTRLPPYTAALFCFFVPISC